MEKKYQLVAWTRNVTDEKNVKMFMVPSVEHDAQEEYYSEITRCQKELERRNGYYTTSLARRFMKVYEANARFHFLCGHYGDAVRFLCKAALYCIWEDDCNWVYWDTDLGSYSQFCGKLRVDFERLSEEAIAMAKKYSREDVLLENEPALMIKLYNEHNAEMFDMEKFIKSN